MILSDFNISLLVSDVAGIWTYLQKFCSFCDAKFISIHLEKYNNSYRECIY